MGFRAPLNPKLQYIQDLDEGREPAYAVNLGEQVPQSDPQLSQDPRGPAAIPEEEKDNLFRVMYAQQQADAAARRKLQEEQGRVLDLSRGQQEKGIKDLEGQRLALDSQEQGIDFMPLMALTDAWTGSNFTQSYKRPENIQDKKLAIDKMLQDERNKLTQADLERLKLIGNPSGGMDIGQLLRQSGTQDRSILGKKAKFGEGLIADTKKINSEAEDAMQKFDKLETVYAGGNLRQITSILGDTAKYIGGNMGATSDADAARQLFQTLEERVANLKTVLGDDGVLPPQEVKSMVELIRKCRAAAAKAYEGKLESVTEAYRMQSQILGMPELMAPGSPAMQYIKSRNQKAATGFASPETRGALTNTGVELAPKDKQALDWANANPSDPRAIQIKKKLGK